MILTGFKSQLQAVAKPMHILVADDHYANRLLTQSLLQREGHEIALANNGKEAVRACMSNVFDLLLLDIQMPIMSGIQALKWIKTLENGNTIAPAFALTAHTHRAEINTILSKGFEAVLQKPFRVSEMMRHLGRPYKNGPERDMGQMPDIDAETKIYENVTDLPLLEVQTLDILLETIGPDRMCTVLKAYWKDANTMISSLKNTRLMSQNREKELTELRKTAHGLKGASANVGLLRASRLSAFLQNAPFEDIPYLIETLENTLQDSQASLRDYCGLVGNAIAPKLAAAS